MVKAIFIGYLIFISLFTFFLFGIDKHKAKHHKWRIPESWLLFPSFAGGGIGALWGIYVFRHKTRHLKFTLGIPIILIFEMIVIFYFLHLH